MSYQVPFSRVADPVTHPQRATYTVLYQRLLKDSVPGRFTSYTAEKAVTMAVLRVDASDLSEVMGWMEQQQVRLIEVKQDKPA